MSLRFPFVFPPRLCMLFLAVFALGLPGCGDSEPEDTAAKSPEQETQPIPPEESRTKTKEPTKETQVAEPPASEQRAANTPESQLRADLEEAISLLEEGDVATFIEYYMPLDVVERIRSQSLTIQEVVQKNNTDGAFQQEFLPKLRSMQKGGIVFLNKDKSRARLQREKAAEDLTPPELDVRDPTTEKIPVTDGFPGDIHEAIGGAIAALEAQEYRKFAENMFPPSELSLTTSDDTLQGLMLRLEEHPQMVEQMLADLKALKELTPQTDKQNLTATFELHQGTKHARTVRFEKFQTWRFANTAKEVRSEIYQQAQQPLSPTTESQPYTEWIRIRDHWRLSQID